jgi:hypothetical protein
LFVDLEKSEKMIIIEDIGVGTLIENGKVVAD